MRNDTAEYVLVYGNTGALGRFRSAQPLRCRRGDQAVIRSRRGLELGTVMCPARESHALLLPDTEVGELIRTAREEDREGVERVREQGRRLFEGSRLLAAELELPLEVLDSEVLLDGRHAVLYHLQWSPFDAHSFLTRLDDQFDLQVSLHDLALPASTEEEHAHEHEGCGSGSCGSGGGCGSCSSGGCSSCTVGKAAAERFTVADQTALRGAGRTPIL